MNNPRTDGRYLTDESYVLETRKVSDGARSTSITNDMDVTTITNTNGVVVITYANDEANIKHYNSNGDMMLDELIHPEDALSQGLAIAGVYDQY